MTTTISTSTQATPFARPHASVIDRGPDGDLFCMIKNTAGNFELFRSTDNGANWSTRATVTRANVQELGSFHVDQDGLGYWCYRTYESGQDRVYTRRFHNIISGTVSVGGELLLAAATAATAGDIYQGLDIAKAFGSNDYCFVVVAVGITQGSTNGVILFGEVIAPSGAAAVNHGIVTGKRWWLSTGTGRISPSIDVEHGGDGKTGYPGHLWLTWGRTDVRMVKCPWNGNGWTGPASPQVLTSGTPLAAQDQISGRWDGQQFLIAVPDPDDTDTVRVLQRNRANSTTTVRNTPAHPTGVVRNCTLSYDSVTRDIRVFAIGTSTTVLYFVDFDRGLGTWGAWTVVHATALSGTAGINYSVRRGTYGNARYDIAHATATPAQLHTQQSMTSPPNTPTWQYGTAITTPGASGAAMDTATSLTLDWLFSDPDAGDTQASFVLSRQVGALAIEYWRTSDGTWQSTEQINTSSSSFVTLSATQWSADGLAGGATDPLHAYRVKVRDAPGTASGFSTSLLVLPSTRVDPAITSPTAGSVQTTSAVPVVWTASQQTKYRLRLRNTGIALSDLYTRSVSNGHGTPTTGPAWTVVGTAADYSVDGNSALMSLTTTATERRALAAVDLTDASIVRTVTVPVTPTGANIVTTLYLRRTDDSNFVDARLFHTTAGTVTCAVRQVIGGVESNVVGFPTIAGVTATSAIRVRFDAVGGQLRMRAWLASGSEPVLWDAQTITDHVVSGSAGHGATRSTGNTNGTVAVDHDDMEIQALGDYLWDSGLVVSTALTATPGYALLDGGNYTVELETANDEGLLSNVQPRQFTVDYINPMTPTLVATPVPASGWIAVTITNPAPSGGAPALLHQDLYRRVAAVADDGVLVQTGLASAATYNDWQAVSGVAYEYRVMAVGVNGAVAYGAWTP